MVSKKRVARKIERDAETIVIEAAPSMPKTVTFTEDPESLRMLLDEAPAVPTVTSIEQAVAWFDKYAKWKAKTRK